MEYKQMVGYEDYEYPNAMSIAHDLECMEISRGEGHTLND